MRAYHFLKSDMRSDAGNEPPWQVGEERTWHGMVRLCYSGYHSSPTWLDALSYAPGPIACLVEVSEPVEEDGGKQVSRTRKLLAAAKAERELRLFACDCAERALQREGEAGREPERRCWNAIAVARRFAHGEATSSELATASAAAWDAAYAADRAAAATWDAARDAAWAAATATACATACATDGAGATTAASAAANAASWAATHAARYVVVRIAARYASEDTKWNAAAAQAAERDWQRQRLAEYLDPLIEEQQRGGE